MHRRRFCFVVVFTLFVPLLAWGQKAGENHPPQNGGDFSSNTEPLTKVPEGVILVKGAWSSASDSVTPRPEDGRVTGNVFSNQYFGITYALPPDWTEKYEGPPPSDSGLYVLAQFRPADTYKGPSRGSILITAQDLFFTQLPTTNARELIHYTNDNLQADYKVEVRPSVLKVAGHAFSFFVYNSPVAQLHWYVLATQIRCHAVELVLTSRDARLLKTTILDMNTKMKLPVEASPTAGTGGGAVPVCIKDYASDENVMARVDPIFAEHRFNPVPVRIIINKEGKVHHIHFLSSFPDQEKAITDALRQWKFRPYLRDGQRMEVETGIMFGRAPYRATPSAGNPATE
jgi:hypothetical protein